LFNLLKDKKNVHNLSQFAKIRHAKAVFSEIFRTFAKQNQ